MDITINPALTLGGPMLNIGRAGFPYLPTVTGLDIAWQAERALAAPEPARLTAQLWIPGGHLDAYLPKLGAPCWVGLRAGTGHPSVVAFYGRVDKVQRERRHASSYGAPAEPITTDQLGTAISQYGVVQLYTSTHRDEGGETFTLRIPDYLDDGLFTVADVTAAINLSTVAQPNSWLWTSELLDVVAMYGDDSAPPAPPEPLPGTPHRSARAFWRANGVVTPLADGPLQIGATVPPDLALVATLPHGGSLTFTTPVSRPLAAPHGLHPPGEWVSVTASDELATAARFRVGDEPWPLETVRQRLTRIAELGDGLLPGFRVYDELADGAEVDAGNVRIAPRDVDAQPLLTLFSETLATIGAVPRAGEGGVWTARGVQQPRALTASGQVEIAYDAVQLPASALPETSTSTSVTELTNRIRIAYQDVTGTEPTERYHELRDDESIEQWGESSAAWGTSVAYTGGSVTAAHTLAPLIDRLSNALPALSQPSYSFDDALTLTPGVISRLPEGSVRELVSAVSVLRRHGALVYIPDAPEQFGDDSFILLSGSIVFEQATGRVMLLLGVEPAGRSGAPPMRWVDVDAYLTDLMWQMLDPAISWAHTRYLQAES